LLDSKTQTQKTVL